MSDDPIEEEEPAFGLVMPFIVCGEDGYDSNAFVAGCYFGELQALIKLTPFGVEIRRMVPSPLVPQIDLLVMHEGCFMRWAAWADHPDEWTQVHIRRYPFEADEAS